VFTEDFILVQVADDVLRTFQANWVYLLLSIVVASLIQVFLGTDRLAGWLRARTPLAVVGAVALGALTPFCSCGTTAVVLGALASSVPWAPIVAFMVSSPLTSPGEYVLSVGLFGTAFATTYFVAAFVLGLGAGWATHHLERAGLLRNQYRVAADATSRAVVALGRSAASHSPVVVASCCETSSGHVECGECGGDECTPGASADGPMDKAKQFVDALLVNCKRLGILFFGFTALGYLLIRLIPTDVLTSLLGGDSLFAVPVSALLGIPVYVNSDGSLPLVASLMDGGMGAGPAMAFLITGAGTSVGAISGMLLIARWRVVALVVTSLVVGATLTGYVTPLFL
jgi:uncharacterized membrane protein YraQ (UPF0718 family)